VQKAACIQASFSHNFPIWEKVIALFASGRLDPTRLVGRVEPLARWQACFDDMASGKVVKAVITVRTSS
jgi:alcohol dehydrogenase/L-iditol 2-dehydrogenase